MFTVAILGKFDYSNLNTYKQIRFRTSSYTSGNAYKSDEFLREVIRLARLLAKNARLEVPLLQDTDLTDTEFKEIQQQVRIRSVHTIMTT